MFPGTEAFSCPGGGPRYPRDLELAGAGRDLRQPRQMRVERLRIDRHVGRVGALALRAASPEAAPAGSGMRVGTRDKAYVTAYATHRLSSNRRHQYEERVQWQRGLRAPRLPDTAGRRVRRPPRRVLSRQRPGTGHVLPATGRPSNGARCCLERRRSSRPFEGWLADIAPGSSRNRPPRIPQSKG